MERRVVLLHTKYEELFMAGRMLIPQNVLMGGKYTHWYIDKKNAVNVGDKKKKRKEINSTSLIASQCNAV